MNHKFLLFVIIEYVKETTRHYILHDVIATEFIGQFPENIAPNKSTTSPHNLFGHLGADIAIDRFDLISLLSVDSVQYTMHSNKYITVLWRVTLGGIHSKPQ